MDPNATLRDILATARWMKDAPAGTPVMRDGIALTPWDLADMVENLNRWLEQGGFPPDVWAEAFCGGLANTVNSIAIDVGELLVGQGCRA